MSPGITDADAAIAIVDRALSIFSDAGMVYAGTHTQEHGSLILGLKLAGDGRGSVDIFGVDAKGERMRVLRARWPSNGPVTVAAFRRGAWEKEIREIAAQLPAEGR